MRIDTILTPFPPLGAIPMKYLIVEESYADKTKLCENCGKPHWSHEDLAVENKDWCINCNDDERGLSPDELALWTLDQVAKGLVIAVVSKTNPHSIVVNSVVVDDEGGEEE